MAGKFVIKLSSYALALTIVLIGFFTVHAQALPLEEDQLVIVQGTNLTIYDLDRLQMTENRSLSLKSENPNEYVSEGIVDYDRQIAFLVISTPRPIRRTETTPSRIIQIDLNTGEEKLIYQRNGIIRLLLSPNGEQAIVTYHWNDQITRDEPEGFCILTFSNGVCDEIELMTRHWRISWIDEHEFVVLQLEDEFELLIFDATTRMFRGVNLPEQWFVYTAIAIPNTRHVLLSVLNRGETQDFTPQLFRYYVDDQQLAKLDYDLISVDYAGAPYWLFSADQRYLLYGSSHQAALIDFQTGEVIGEFSDVTQASWSTANQMILVSEGQTLLVNPQGQPIQTVLPNISGLILPFHQGSQ